MYRRVGGGRRALTALRGGLAAKAPPAEARFTAVVGTSEADGTTCTTENGSAFGRRSGAQELGELDLLPGRKNGPVSLALPPGPAGGVAARQVVSALRIT